MRFLCSLLFALLFSGCGSSGGGPATFVPPPPEPPPFRVSEVQTKGLPIAIGQYSPWLVIYRAELTNTTARDLELEALTARFTTTTPAHQSLEILVRFNGGTVFHGVRTPTFHELGIEYSLLRGETVFIEISAGAVNVQNAQVGVSGPGLMTNHGPLVLPISRPTAMNPGGLIAPSFTNVVDMVPVTSPAHDLILYREELFNFSSQDQRPIEVEFHIHADRPVTGRARLVVAGQVHDEVAVDTREVTRFTLFFSFTMAPQARANFEIRARLDCAPGEELTLTRVLFGASNGVSFSRAIGYPVVCR